jgi:hypothetical protein
MPAPATAFSPRQSKNPQPFGLGVLRNKSLAMTYFHTGIRTIIGAELFHGPVRDGKGWFQLAMVTRHKGLQR